VGADGDDDDEVVRRRQVADEQSFAFVESAPPAVSALKYPLMSATPLIRANWSKYTLRHLRRLPAAARQAVLAETGEGSLAQIGSAGVLAWLPAEHHARIFDAAHKVLGEPGAVAFWCDVMLSNFEQPLLRPLVQGGMRLFGGTPYSIYRMSPHAWSLVTRDCGAHSVTRGDGSVEACVAFDDLPRVLQTAGFVAHCMGNCEAVLRFLGLRGAVGLAPRQRAGSLMIEVANVSAASSVST
jgi:hypothetical protein